MANDCILPATEYLCADGDTIHRSHITMRNGVPLILDTQCAHCDLSPWLINEWADKAVFIPADPSVIAAVKLVFGLSGLPFDDALVSERQLCQQLAGAPDQLLVSFLAQPTTGPEMRAQQVLVAKLIISCFDDVRWGNADRQLTVLRLSAKYLAAEIDRLN